MLCLLNGGGEAYVLDISRDGFDLVPGCVGVPVLYGLGPRHKRLGGMVSGEAGEVSVAQLVPSQRVGVAPRYAGEVTAGPGAGQVRSRD